MQIQHRLGTQPLKVLAVVQPGVFPRLIGDFVLVNRAIAVQPHFHRVGAAAVVGLHLLLVGIPLPGRLFFFLGGSVRLFVGLLRPLLHLPCLLLLRFPRSEDVAKIFAHARILTE